MSASEMTLEQAVEEFLQLRRSGRAADARDFAERHPHLAPELLAALESAELLELARAAEPSRDDALPERFGDFRVLERLGGGGMGIVYRARQESLGRDVALKLIRPEQLYFPSARERFRREAQAAAQLQHPGIVPIHTVGESHGVPFLAMELVQGATLAQALHELRARHPESVTGADLAEALRRTTPEASGWDERAAAVHFARGYVETVVKLVVQVAGALHHAHSREVLHRDVKPSNIAVTCDARALLFDFGLAGIAGGERRLTATQAEVGSLPYMPPERLRGTRTQFDRRSDVYALGVTLYELLSLRLPFAESDALHTRERILSGNPPGLRSRNRNVSRELEIVCAKAMELEPRQRYPDAAAFARDLENVLAQRRIEARPTGPVLAARRWARRHPWTALTLFLLVAGPSGLLWREVVHARELAGALGEVQRQREAAQLEARDAGETSAFLTGLFDSVDPSLARGREVSARELLDEATRRLDAGHLANQPAVRARLLHAIGESYAGLGEWDAARRLLVQSLELGEGLEGGANLAVVRSLAALASLDLQFGDDGALPRAQRAIEVHRSLGLPEGFEFAELLVTLAMAQAQAGELAQAQSSLAAADRALDGLAGDWRSARAGVLVNRADIELELRDYDAAIATAREGVRLQRESDPAPHPAIGTGLNTIALAQRGSGRFDEARATYAELLAEEERLTGPESSRLAGFLVSAAGLDLDTARPAEARIALERARGVFERTAPRTFANALVCLEKLALALERLDQRDEALAVLRERRNAVDEAFGASSWQALAARLKLAQCHVGAGDDASARALLEETLAAAEERAADDDDGWESAAAAELSALAARAGELPLARASLARARRLRSDAELRSAAQAWTRWAAGLVAHSAGDPALAQREWAGLAELARGPAHAEAAPALARARLALLAMGDEGRGARQELERAVAELKPLLGAQHALTRELADALAQSPR